MHHVHERLQRELQAREEANALRSLQVYHDLIDFASNDYLGFAGDPELKQRIQEEIAQLPYTGSGGSRLLTGNNAYVELVEREIAEFHSAKSALFFNSGYEANQGLIATVVHRHDVILYDAYIHASLREGIRLSHAKAFSFAHNNMQELEQLLEQHRTGVFIVTESVFSMDGDRCPLPEIVALAKRYDAALILDEAHATGVLGERGEGLAQMLGLQDDIFARVHTFGKAMGTNGAVVLGDDVLRKYLINFCKPFIYTTAPNYLQLASVRIAYKYMQENDAAMRSLRINCTLAIHLLADLDIKPVSTDAAIFSFIVPGNATVRTIAKELQGNGFDVRPILSPTVPSGMERVRICMHAFNTPVQISEVLQHVQTAISKHR